MTGTYVAYDLALQDDQWSFFPKDNDGMQVVYSIFQEQPVLMTSLFPVGLEQLSGLSSTLSAQPAREFMKRMMCV